MSDLVTLVELRDRIRFEADMVNSTRVTDAQLTRLVNTHRFELYDRLVAAGPPDYYATTGAVTTIVGTVAYALPSDFRSLLGVFRDATTTRRKEVRPLTDGHRASYDAPQAIESFTIEYVPVPVALVEDGDSTDGVSGWDELVVQLCARAILRRERRDTSAFDRAIDECRARVMAAAPKRDVTGPRYIHDVEAADGAAGYDDVAAYRLSAGTIQLYSISTSVWP